MKTPLLLVCGAIYLVTVLSATAQKAFPISDLYCADFDVLSISTNAEGQAVENNFGNFDLVREAAKSAGVTNLAGLFVVYNVRHNALEVWNIPGEVLIGTPVTFSSLISLPNPQKTEIQIFGSVYWKTNTAPVGSIVGSESIRYGLTNQITDFYLVSQVQFGLSGGGTNGPAIYLGHLTVESKAGTGSGAPSPLDPK